MKLPKPRYTVRWRPDAIKGWGILIDTYDKANADRVYRLNILKDPQLPYVFTVTKTIKMHTP